MNRIEDFLRTQLGIADEFLLQKGKNIAYIREVRKGEYLVKDGDQLTGLYFLLNGLLRGYFVDCQGNEVTDCFGFRYGDPATPAADYNAPLPINIVAVENSQVLVLPVQAIHELMQEYVEVVHIYNRLLIASLTEHWEVKTALYQYSAAKRYQWFLQKYEGLIDRVPHIHIASFLGISPVTLSRLRSRLKEQGNAHNENNVCT